MKRMRCVTGCISFLFVLAVLSPALAQGPVISPERVKARKELGQLGVEYSRSSFVKQALEGDTIAVQLFLAAGMDPNGRDSTTGNNALMAAASEGHLETINVLLAGGADAKSALIAAARLDIVKVLLEHGADVNTRGPYGETALIAAAGLGQADRVKLLLERGAEVNVKNLGQSTALMGAVDAVAQLTINNNGTPPRAEVLRQRTDTVKLLVEHNADVNAVDREGRTPLLIAARGGAVEIERYLLDHGANVNAREKVGSTALEQAITRGDTEMVKILLAKGADVNAVGTGRTPLNLASVLQKTDIVQLLISAGAKQ